MKKEGGGGVSSPKLSLSSCQAWTESVWGQTSLFTQIRPTKRMFWFQTSRSNVCFQIDKKCHWLLRQKLWLCHCLLEQKFSPMSQKNVSATSETNPTISNRVLPEKRFPRKNYWFCKLCSLQYISFCLGAFSIDSALSQCLSMSLGLPRLYISQSTIESYKSWPDALLHDCMDMTG